MWSPVNTAKFFWPIGDCINGVTLQVVLCTAVYSRKLNSDSDNNDSI